MLDNLFASLKGKKLVVAVSGGCDSMALMNMLQTWNGAELHVATVNHGLRAESQAECERVVAWSGGKAKILHWEGEKPQAGLQNAAREARYALLADYANEVGADVIVTAHTMNDQAETVMMRLFKGSSPSGMAGMSAWSEKHGVALFRPLLWMTRENIKSYAPQYIDDPSNDNDKFTRVRVRKMLPLLEDEGLTIERLAKFAARQNMHNEAIDFYASELMEKIKINAKPLLEAPFITTLKVFSKLLASAGDETIPERLEKLEELVVGCLEALAASQPFHATLRGAKVTLSPSGLLRIVKEPPRS